MMRTLAVLFGMLAMTPFLSHASESVVERAPGQAARFFYEGFIGGVRVGAATADVAFTADAYAAKLKLETAGMAGLLFSWRHASTAAGAAASAGETPLIGAHYRNESLWKGKNRLIEVAYRDSIAELSAADPDPVAEEGRPEISADLRLNVIDPLSAIVALGRQVETTGRCDANFGVFDGRRRYQMVATDEGVADTGKSRYAPYGGDARVCSFVFEKVAGFKRKKIDEEPTSGAVFLRHATPYAPLMPVKIVVGTKYGDAILHLKQVERIDATLAALAAQKLEPRAPQ